jgi:hypothetical protein
MGIGCPNVGFQVTPPSVHSMTAKLILTPEARADIAGAAAWYRGRSIRAGDNFRHLLRYNLV